MADFLYDNVNPKVNTFVFDFSPRTPPPRARTLCSPLELLLFPYKLRIYSMLRPLLRLKKSAKERPVHWQIVNWNPCWCRTNSSHQSLRASFSNHRLGNEDPPPFSTGGAGWDDAQTPTIAANSDNTVGLMRVPLTTCADSRLSFATTFMKNPGALPEKDHCRCFLHRRELSCSGNSRAT